MISAAGVIDHEAQYGDDDYLCYADHRSDLSWFRALTLLEDSADNESTNTFTKTFLVPFPVTLDRIGCGSRQVHAAWAAPRPLHRHIRLQIGSWRILRLIALSSAWRGTPGELTSCRFVWKLEYLKVSTMNYLKKCIFHQSLRHNNDTVLNDKKFKGYEAPIERTSWVRSRIFSYSNFSIGMTFVILCLKRFGRPPLGSPIQSPADGRAVRSKWSRYGIIFWSNL